MLQTAKGLLQVLHYNGMQEAFNFYAFYDDVYIRHGYFESYPGGLLSSVDASSLSGRNYVLLFGMPPKELGQMTVLATKISSIPEDSP